MVAPALQADGRELDSHPRGFLWRRGSLRSLFSFLLPSFLMSLRPPFPSKCLWLGRRGLH